VFAPVFVATAYAAVPEATVTVSRSLATDCAVPHDVFVNFTPAVPVNTTCEPGVVVAVSATQPSSAFSVPSVRPVEIV
jgi:hypothetical protein